MSITQRNFLKKNFKGCEKGKFDYCFAFIEKSLRELSKNGKMSYLIPSSIFKIVFGQEIRLIMKPKISRIYDYTEEKIFNNALVKSAIVILDNKINKESFIYNDVSMNKSISVNRNLLGEKWIFDFIKNNEGKRFGDYFSVFHAVATLYNEAFVIPSPKKNKDGNYIYESIIIEKEVVKEASTPRSMRTGKKENIIFPYKYDKNHNVVRYSEKEFLKKFPGAYKYLNSKREKLDNRKKDTGAEWFEYGRSQALCHLDCEKCLVSNIISKKLNIFLLSKNCIPYSGMFIIKKEGNIKYSLDNCIKILKTDKFLEYVRRVGIHMNGTSIRITCKDIEEYRF